MILAAVAVSVAACSTETAGPKKPNAPSVVQVSVTNCGVGWTNTASGAQDITVHNTDMRPGEAQLINPRSGAVYADVEPLGPGTEDTVHVSLSAGRYAWRCLMEDEPAVTGATVQLSGAARGSTPAVMPVSQADLIPATQAYQRYVTGRLPRLLALTRQLSSDVAAGRMAAARRAWLPAHLEYERLGAAYDAFGDLDAAINGLPDGLPGGVHDAKWTGFHRIEYGLWHGQSRTSLLPYTKFLVGDVKGLADQFAGAELEPLQIAIRAHEISENALQFELTGRTDFGSHSQLATVGANLQGTAVVLRIVGSLVAPRYPALSRALAALHTAQADLAHASHERVDADISELCELLAPIAAVLEPRRTS